LIQSDTKLVIVPFARSDVRKSSHAERAAKAWNELPADAVDFSFTENFNKRFVENRSQKILHGIIVLDNLIFYVTAGVLFTCYRLQLFN
jgi:hypothetical protein